MKTIKILVLVSILAVTQSFAFSKTQKNILLGIGAGAIIIHALESHNKVVYVDSNYSQKKHKKHHSRANRYNKHYSRNDYRYNSLTVNKHNRRGHSRY